MNKEMTKNRLLEILLSGTDEELAEIIEDVHPADILDIIHEEDNNLAKILKILVITLTMRLVRNSMK